MELLVQGQARLTCVGEQLILYLSAQLFSPEIWAWLSRGFKSEGNKDDWRNAPFRVMTLEEDIPGYPRWKRVTLDGLSWLIFHLLVPADHKLVKLWQTVDWVAINRLCAGMYNNSKYGQRAWAPAQMFALLLLYFVLPLSSECELMRTVAIVPLYRWFCGFGLFGPLPDHSTLHDFRKKMKRECFEVILTWVVWRCKKAGLISNRLLHFDMTGVAASSRPWSPYERAVLLTMALIRYWDRQSVPPSPDDSLSEAALHQLMAEVAIEVLENKSLKKNPKAPERILRSIEHWTEREQQAPGQALWDLNLEEAGRVLLAESQEEVEFVGPQKPNAQRAGLKEIAKGLKAQLIHAVGDRDARMGWINNVRLVCGYWLGFLVDDSHGVITAVNTVPLNIDQRTQMTVALEVHRERVGAYPKAVAADSAQDYYAVHQMLDEHQIKGHISSRGYGPSGNGLPVDYFAWDEEKQLHCPAGHVLTAGPLHRTGKRFYEAQAADCQGCLQRETCLPKKQLPNGPRRIYLDAVVHQRWQQNREHTCTQEYKEAQARRFASEGYFGLAKRLHGADKMPYRSEAMNEIAGVLIAICMDLAILARHGHTL
jgi:transposase